jgi:hypothetical protein
VIAEAKARAASLPLAERTLAIYDDAVRGGLVQERRLVAEACWPSHGQH